MTDYDDREERAALESQFDELPAEDNTSTEVSTVVSVRLRGGELAMVEQAATAAGMPISTFIRRAALEAASPVDVRSVSVCAETIQDEVQKLVALLHGKAA